IAVARSPEAAALWRESVALLQPPLPVEVREGDLLGPLAGERYRAIVSNPPYLTEAEYAALDPAVRSFEPREALASGADGLTATRALLEGAAALLEPGGCVVLEIDERRADATRRLALRHGWSRVGVYDDLFGRRRFLLAEQIIVHPHRSEEHTSELQSRGHLVCRLLLEKKNNNTSQMCSLSALNICISK